MKIGSGDESSTAYFYDFVVSLCFESGKAIAIGNNRAKP